MGRIVVSENVSLDGIMQDPTGEEGFKFGGWFDQMPDDVRAEWAKVEYQEALDSAAWLVGRRTYSYFAERWTDQPGEWADRLRTIPKYVVSSTLDDATEWANSTVLKGDVVEQATKLKQTVDGDILVYGSGPLVQMLMEHDLVDELRLMTHPFVLGTGERLFRETSDHKPVRLVNIRAIGNSLALLIYQPVRNA
ncbi:MAG TPA: dihydrofolate reductase family protein [Streptosporangiaceae bacterium]